MAKREVAVRVAVRVSPSRPSAHSASCLHSVTCACVCACVRTRVRHLGAMFVEELQGQVCRSTSALENVQRMREANSHQHAAWPWQRTVGEPCMSPHGRCPLLVCTSALLSMCSGTSTWLSRGFTTTCGGVKHTLSRHCSPYTHTRMHARTHTHTDRKTPHLPLHPECPPSRQEILGPVSSQVLWRGGTQTSAERRQGVGSHSSEEKELAPLH